MKTPLATATWIPKTSREWAQRAFDGTTARGRELLAPVLATKSPHAVAFWVELVREVLPSDVTNRLQLATISRAIELAASKQVGSAGLRNALLAIVNAEADAVAAFDALGQGPSLADAHGIYVAAARKASPAALPKSPPHLGGPQLELSVFETVEVAIALAARSLELKPHDEAQQLLATARKVLAWYRVPHNLAAKPPFAVWQVPKAGNPKEPSYVLARAALMEACNVDKLSARGTSVKSAAMRGLSLKTESWWLEQVDEALMLGDARTAWERRKQTTSSPITRLVWRGGDATTRLWLVQLASGDFALLSKLGRTWASSEGDFDSVVATLPAQWFERAMPVIETRRFVSA